MSELSNQELTVFSKVLQEYSVEPKAVGLEHLRRANQTAETYIAVLKSAAQSIDADSDTTVSDLNHARDAIANVYVALCDKRREGESASQLSALISEAATLHNNLNTLSWLVGEDQADHDETLPGAFTNADDLFKAMGV